jgi:mannose-6-phosphate isomerase
MESLYPLKFKTIFKDKIWGGQKIRQVLGKDFSPLPNCGETWEISGVEGNVSVVKEGPLEGNSLTELIQTYKEDLLGKKVYERFGNEFPLLVKFIDANEDLSIQVHPDDELAKRRHNSFGKTEMWYIIQADKGSKLVSGFQKPVNKEVYLEHLQSHKLYDILNQEEVQDGDVFFIPAGRVHTIGKGLLLAEIQQTSDITYRIYDFDRVDSQGNKRELHTELALDAIDYKKYDQYKTAYQDKANQPVNLVTCPYFTTNKLTFNQSLKRDYWSLDSFVVHVCVEGSYEIRVNDKAYKAKKGDALLLPAVISNVELVTDHSAQVLESFVS